MKNRILKMIVITLLLAASGSTAVPVFADGFPPPLCYPKPCDGGIAR